MAIVFLAAFLSGCTMLPGWKEQPRGEAIAAPKDTSPTRQQRVADAGDERGALDAVEEFLKRTEEYELSEAAAPTAHAPPLPSQSMSQDRRPRVEALQSRLRETERSGSDPVAPDAAVANGQVALEPTSAAEPRLALPVIQTLSVVAGRRVERESSDTPTSRTTNEPLDVGTRPTPGLVDRLFAELRGGEDTRTFEDEWTLRLLALAFGRDEQPATVSAELPAEAAALLSALIRLAVDVRGLARNPSEPANLPLQQVEAMRRLLLERADPVVSTVALCRRVVTFGVYDELTEGDLLAGRPVQMIVYTEIENLSAETSSDGRYVTRLATRLELLTAEGQSVWSHQEPEVVDSCMRPRRDFFVAQRVTLPPTLPAGEYVLKVFVEDKTSGRAGEKAYPFRIEAPMPVANRG